MSKMRCLGRGSLLGPRWRLAAAVMLMCLPTIAAAWWNNDWAYRKKISLDGSQAPALGVPVQQVLVPVRLHMGNFTFFDAQPEGADLRFVAGDDKTPLPFHAEQYDAVNGIAILWVQVPSVGAKDSAIYLYYGNPQAPAAGDSKGTYDPHTVAAYHFAERSGTPRDSTGYNNHAVASGAAAGTMGAAGFGLGLVPNQSVRIPASPSLNTVAESGWTAGLWVRPGDAAAGGRILGRSEPGRSLVLGLSEGKPYLAVANGARAARIQSERALDGGSWHHVAFTLGDRAHLFVDGREVASGDARLPEFRGDILLGADESGSGGLLADIDELRISNVARSAEWVRAAAVAEDPQSALAQYGGDESGGGGEYLGVLRTLVNAVSLDGWIVIGMIAVLGFTSGVVMAEKMRLLGRVRRQNEDFLRIFRDASSPFAHLDPAAAEAHLDRWADSPLYHVFRRGVHESLGVQRLTGGEMTPQALEVVRAGLDAAIVEESHRLNDRLVLLTMSVSGAPFLGLLGTVVGIMITFASIAMAGDVNVNTIAPGVAAALTATVSGLLVAIPVLFGYNYLATRIAQFIANMEVFANELLGKLALRSATAARAPAAA